MYNNVELVGIQEENKYFVKKEAFFFSITEIVFLIIKKKQQDWTVSEIADFLNEEKNTDFYCVDIIEQILSSKELIPIFSETIEDSSKTKYIFLKKKLVNPSSIVPILNFFANKLFNRTLLISLFAISSLASLLFIIFYHNDLFAFQKELNTNILEKLPEYILIYVLYILIVFFHEIGHTSAAYKYGVLPKQIGFGFYFTMPVLYTELTEIYTLKKNEKIIVNIAGIYIQLIINLILIALILVFPANLVFSVLFLINSLNLFFALNPFFKNDGYWVFSDYFNISNLEKKADKCFIQLFRFVFTPKKSILYLKDKARILILYSFINFLFWFYFFYKSTKYMVINANLHYHKLLEGFDIVIYLKVALYLFFVFLFLKSTYSRIKSIIAD